MAQKSVLAQSRTFNPRAKKSLPAAFPQEEALFVKVHNRVRCAL